MDCIIAAFFSLAGKSFVFPEPSISSASNTLHMYTEEQAQLMIENSEFQKLNVLGPAGTGKTWMLINSVMKLYWILIIRRKTGKILVVTYNKALSLYIEDSIEKLMKFQNPQEKIPKNRNYKVFTMDALKKHIEKKMRGKIAARRSYTSNCDETSLDDNLDFEDVFKEYEHSVSRKTLLDNFGYCGIFIDEVISPERSRLPFLIFFNFGSRLVFSKKIILGTAYSSKR